MQTLKKILFLLTPQEKKRVVLLLVIITIMTFLDVIGVASILPFMAVLTNPDLIKTNSILNSMFSASSIFGVKNTQQFIFALGVLIFILLIISLTFKALAAYVQARFIYMREYSIGKRFVEGYLHQPYSWFLSCHSADLGKTILSEVQLVILNGIKPLIDLIAKSMIAIAIITLLIIVDLKITIIIGCILAGAYLLIFYFVRDYLDRSGSKSLINNKSRFITINEAFSAAKEVKIGGLERNYVNRFSNFAQVFARAQASSAVIAQLPRFALEAIAFGGALLLILYVINRTGSFNTAIPIVSLYVFAGYRLMPSLQGIYESFTQLTYIGPSLDKLYNDLKNFKLISENQTQDTLPLNKKITLKNIHYNYPDASKTSIKDISLSIDAKSTVGLVGATGSGKTTVADIILGLLDPQIGTLEVDEKIITKKNLRSWQRSIGYVPQHIFLADNTIANNIAFGLEPKDINQEALEKASKIANLHHFVLEELPKQYQTIIGERGVRLSGGQRQRIGIARALYHNPQLLILDEATNALDTQTEKAVMDAINNIGKNITIILISHRLNTLKKCDKNFLLEKGELKKELTYEELINHDKDYFSKI